MQTTEESCLTAPAGRYVYRESGRYVTVPSPLSPGSTPAQTRRLPSPVAQGRGKGEKSSRGHPRLWRCTRFGT